MASHYTFENEYVSLFVQEFIETAPTPAAQRPEQQTAYNPAYFPAEPVKKLQIQGSFKNPSQFSKIELVAPRPIQRGVSYSGAALPFPCAQMAFDQTPNYIDLTRLVDGATQAPTDIQTVFDYPNSYYAIDHRTLVPPSLFVILTPIAGSASVNASSPIYVRFELPNPHPLKTLTYRPEFAAKGPAFYAEKAERVGVPVNQEAYLRQIGTLKTTYGLA